MERIELAKEIFNISHITGRFELRSGAVSNEYFDKYLFESRPQVLLEIVRQIIPMFPKSYDLLAGLEMGGIPIATMISSITGVPVVFVRKKAKEYGTKKIAEGPSVEGKNLLIVEDVITSGGQVVISANELRSRGAIITHSVCVIDRESGGKEALANAGIELKALFTMSELKAAAAYK